MFCLIKGKRDWNHTWHRDTFIIYRRSLQTISSLFPQTLQAARLMRNWSRVWALHNQRERRKKKSAVSNYIQGDKTVSQTQRQLQGCQHSSWYCRTSLWSVPNLPDCHWRSRGVLEQRSRVQGRRCNLTPVCLLAGHSCWLGHNTHTSTAENACWNIFLREAINTCEENTGIVCS